MSRRSSVYRCRECGWESPKWLGRCGGCRSWGSVEEAVSSAPSARGMPPMSPARPIGEVDADDARALPTGLAEFDRVLGGGLVGGSVVLIAGEPGVGKSTLMVDVAARFAQRHGRVLYVSGEESASQVRRRADRVGAVHPQLYLAAEQSVAAVETQLDAVRPGLLLVDSVQTLSVEGVEGVSGGVTQVREVAARLTARAKRDGFVAVLIGHVTKDGQVAGPRVLEHLVDVVLHLDGEPHSPLRFLRAAKNRFGSTEEVGCFSLTERGLGEVTDPSGLFVTRRAAPLPGTCPTVSVRGSRPLVAEVQALVARSALAAPRRSTAGLDAARVAMVLAVLERRARLPLAGHDVFVATVGGARLDEPSSDLAVALAVATASTDGSVPAGLAAVGEVGLAGEVRPVSGIDRRVAEAVRRGFHRVLVPAGSGVCEPGAEVIEVRDVAEALRTLTHLTLRSAESLAVG
ncbi:MAG: DNA repair protein RadA [Acidothermus sp.]|nr:DNA repair protein RadA [Acidothermus sp.]